ncbi:MAG: hypothetical protein LUH12_09110, partial [Bacteroides sp.]|nr:hypothetical protein [Bacteroides sp.]
MIFTEYPWFYRIWWLFFFFQCGQAVVVGEFVLPVARVVGIAAVPLVDSGVHGINGCLPGNIFAVYLRGKAATFIGTATGIGAAAPVAGGHGTPILSHHAAGVITLCGDGIRGVVAGGHGAVAVASHYAAGKSVAGDGTCCDAGGYGPQIVSHHAAHIAAIARDCFWSGAASYGAVVVFAHYAADTTVAGYGT